MGRLTRMFLWVVLGAFAFGALLGILAIFDVGPNRDSWKLIAMMFSVLLFGLTSLGTAVVYEKRKWRPMMRVSWGVSGLGLLVFLGIIAAEPHGETPFKLTAILANLAIVLPYLGLMSLVRLDGWRAQIKYATFLISITTAIYIAMMILWEPDWQIRNNYRLGEILGLLCILTGLVTVTMPVMHWIYGTQIEVPPESTRLELEVKCPRCEITQTIPNGKSACKSCGLRFELKVEEPRCECGYLLFRLESPVCPECGRGVNLPSAMRGAFAIETSAIETPRGSQHA